MQRWVIQRPSCVTAATVFLPCAKRGGCSQYHNTYVQNWKANTGTHTKHVNAPPKYSVRLVAISAQSDSSSTAPAITPPPSVEPSPAPASSPVAPHIDASSKVRLKRKVASGHGASGHGTRGSGRSPSAAAAAAQEAADALFTDPGPGPLQAPRIGPVRVAELPDGLGRALVTRRTVQAGELLMALRPLALAWDPQRAPRIDGGGRAAADIDPADAKFMELQRQLLARRFSPREAAWLASLPGLATGTQGREGAQAASTSTNSGSLPPPPELDTVDTEGGEAEDVQVPLPTRLRDPDVLADLVQANSLEADGGAEDEYVYWARREAAATAAATAAAENRLSDGSPSTAGVVDWKPQRRRRGPIGLWPEAALLRHSCQPNTVVYVVGDTLFVRAARKVAGGTQLTVTYLPVGGGYDDADDDGDLDDEQGGGGEEEDEEEAEEEEADRGAKATLLSPLSVRRAALEELRGFTCCCNRCTAEESLDPKLQALIADISLGATALRSDLQTALALAELDDDEGEEDEEEEDDDDDDEGVETHSTTSSNSGSGISPQPQGLQGAREGVGGPERAATGVKQQRVEAARAGRADEEEGSDDDNEAAVEGDLEGGDSSRWRQMVSSVVDRAGLYMELMDAAMVKLRLTTAQQVSAQSAVAQLYTVLWAALGIRGDLEPQLAELVSALVEEVAPGSADHLGWTRAARETAEMIVATEEEEARDEATTVRRGGGGFSRPQDDRVTIADKTCYKAFTIRYGPISRGVYRLLLEARTLREDSSPE